MKNIVKLAAVATMALAPLQTNAATGNIPFSGTVADTCVVTVGSPGTLGANAGFTTLGSQEAGGSAGTATVLTTGTAFSLSADAPSAFDSAPAGGGAGVTFASNYSATGDNAIAQTSGTVATALGAGTSAVSINMSADKKFRNFCIWRLFRNCNSALRII